MRISDWSSDVCSSDLEFGGDACQCDEPHSRRNRLMVSKQVEDPEASGERELQRAHDERSLIEPTEGHEQQHEDDRQRGGYDYFQPLGCAFQIFELARPGDRDAGREFDILRHRSPEIIDNRGEVTSAHIDIDPGREPAVRGLQNGWPIAYLELSPGAERDLLTRRREDGQCPQFPEAVPDRKSTRLNSSH